MNEEHFHQANYLVCCRHLNGTEHTETVASNQIDSKSAEAANSLNRYNLRISSDLWLVVRLRVSCQISNNYIKRYAPWGE